jgi:hypothetical protein
MTPDKIKAMAEAAGFEIVMKTQSGSIVVTPIPMFRRFANLVLDEAAAACARRVVGDHNREDAEAARCVEAIRALKG